jgi:hypothetical protein
MRGVLAAFLLMPLTLGGPAAAEDGCGRFDWSLSREIELFSVGFTPKVESSSLLPKDGAFTLLLQPVASTHYIVVPERGRDDGYGGVITMEWVAAGRYQVTLSDEAWVDAIQNDRRIAPLVWTRRGDCPGVRLSVQYELESLPLTLQFGGARVQRLNIAVLRVQ